MGRASSPARHLVRRGLGLLLIALGSGPFVVSRAWRERGIKGCSLVGGPKESAKGGCGGCSPPRGGAVVRGRGVDLGTDPQPNNCPSTITSENKNKNRPCRKKHAFETGPSSLPSPPATKDFHFSLSPINTAVWFPYASPSIPKMRALHGLSLHLLSPTYGRWIAFLLPSVLLVWEMSRCCFVLLTSLPSASLRDVLCGSSGTVLRSWNVR